MWALVLVAIALLAWWASRPAGSAEFGTRPPGGRAELEDVLTPQKAARVRAVLARPMVWREGEEPRVNAGLRFDAKAVEAVLAEGRERNAKGDASHAKEGFSFDDFAEGVLCDACAVPIMLAFQSAVVAAKCEFEGCGVEEAVAHAVTNAAVGEVASKLAELIISGLSDAIYAIFGVRETQTMLCVEGLLTDLLLEIEDPLMFFKGQMVAALGNCLCHKLAGVCPCKIPCLSTGPSGPPPTRADLDWNCGDDLTRLVTGDEGSDSIGLYGCPKNLGYYQCLVDKGHPEAVPWNDPGRVNAIMAKMETCADDHWDSLLHGATTALNYLKTGVSDDKRCGPAHAGSERALQAMLAKGDFEWFLADQMYPRCGGGTSPCTGIPGWGAGSLDGRPVRSDCVSCPDGQVLQVDHIDQSRSGLACKLAPADVQSKLNEYGGEGRITVGYRGLDVLGPAPKCVERWYGPYHPPVDCVATAAALCDQIGSCVGVGVNTNVSGGSSDLVLLKSGKMVPDSRSAVLLKPGARAEISPIESETNMKLWDWGVATSQGRSPVMLGDRTLTECRNLCLNDPNCRGWQKCTLSPNCGSPGCYHFVGGYGAIPEPGPGLAPQYAEALR